MTKYDFSKIELMEIGGQVIKDADVYKTIANIVYRTANNLDLIEIAREINSGMVVPLTDSQVGEIKRLISDKQSGMFAFARKAIFDYIDDVQREEREARKKGKEKE